jgi:GTP-binding protein HflX
LNVIDINSKDIEEQKEVTKKILKEIEVSDIPIIEVYNKIDQKNEDYTDKDREVFISAKKGINIESIPNTINKILFGEEVEVYVDVLYTEPKKMNTLESKYNIINKKLYEDKTRFTITIREKQLEKLINGDFDVRRV